MKRILVCLLGAGLLLAGCAPSATRAQAIPLEAYLAPDNTHWYYTAPAGSVQALDQNTDPSSFSSVSSATNSFGPFEINMSNGDSAARDGRPLSMGDKVYPYGIGMHASANLIYRTLQTPGTTCRFTALVGIDDEVGPNGSVVFQVVAGGQTLYDSGVLHGSDTAPKALDVTFPGDQVLSVRVTDAGDNNYYDHADLVMPSLTCAPTQG